MAPPLSDEPQKIKNLKVSIVNENGGVNEGLSIDLPTPNLIKLQATQAYLRAGNSDDIESTSVNVTTQLNLVNYFYPKNSFYKLRIDFDPEYRPKYFEFKPDGYGYTNYIYNDDRGKSSRVEIELKNISNAIDPYL